MSDSMPSHMWKTYEETLCARTVCKNKGIYPHKDLIKVQPGKAHYCLECATSINAECRRFGDEEVFDLTENKK